MNGCRRSVVSLSLLLVSTVVPAAALAQPGGDPGAEPRATGLHERSPEQWEWIRGHVEQVKSVRPNAIGLARINQARRLRGEAPLPPGAAAAPGHEVETDAPMARGGKGDGGSGGAGGTGGTGGTGGAGGSGGDAGELPTRVDNSALPSFPAVADQGLLGSCATFAIAYYQWTHNFGLLAAGWDNANANKATKFSPRWVYDLVDDGANAGSSDLDVYWLLERHGSATWAEFPYLGSRWDPANYRAWDLDPRHWASALRHRSGRLQMVNNLDTGTGLRAAKQLLANGYLLAFGTHVSSWQWTTAGDDPATAADDALSGKPVAFWVNGTSGAHEMAIVGYDDELWTDVNGNGRVDSGEKGAFRVVNSWGTGWREGGFGWLAYDALKRTSAVVGGPSSATRASAFWYGQVTHLPVRPEGVHVPKLLAVFTLSHAARDQLVVELAATEPGRSLGKGTTTLRPEALAANGGPYAFDGSTTAVPATFVVDLTELVPAATSPKRYHLRVTDGASGLPATVLDFRIVDPATGLVEDSAPGLLPRTFDRTSYTAWVDFDGNAPYDRLPVPAPAASVDAGTAPLAVTFDATGSSDPDGDAVEYRWEFGDWISDVASGPATDPNASVVHTYAAPGVYAARLTATDAKGGFATRTLEISVAEPPPAAEAAVTGPTGDASP